MTLITWQDGQPVFRDGKIGTEQDCCCSCECAAGDSLTGKTISCTATLTLPNVPGDCPAGTYTVTFQLLWDAGLLNYQGCAAVDFGGGIFGRVVALLVCDGETYGPPARWTSVCDFSTNGDCDFQNGTCQIGGFLGFFNPFAGANQHTSSTIDGVCVPNANTFTRTDPDLNITSSYTISVT